MKINTKKLITASLCMIVAGAILTGIGILMGGWPGVAFSKNGIQSPYIENDPYFTEKTKIEPFSNIELQIGSYADIRIVPSDDNEFYLEYMLDGDYEKPSYEVRQDTLTLTHKTKHQGGIYFFNITGFSSSIAVNAYITLYIPKGQDMGNLSVHNDSGDVSIEDLSFENAKLNVEYGNTVLQNMVFEDLEMNLDSGNLKAESLTAKSILLDNEYGDITLKDISTKEADLSMESGNLKAAAFDCESIIAKNEYGDINLDDLSAETAKFTLDSGNLYLNAKALTDLACKNEYGDVEIQLPKELSYYTIDAHCEYGSIKLPPEVSEGCHISSDDVAIYKAEGESKGTVKIEVETGDIKISQAITASSSSEKEKNQ